MKYSGLTGIGIILMLVLSQCSTKQEPTPYVYNLNEGWETPNIPNNNPLTEESIELGRLLFFDPALSVDSTISCSSCHHAAFGFADNKPLSFGVKGSPGFRNSGTLTNVAYLPYFNRDGGVKTLDIFASVPIEDHQEMGFNMLLAGQRLATQPSYAKAAQEIYDRDFDGFVITRSIASYLRTFISDNSLYDQVMNKKTGAKFSDAETRGKDLFFSSKSNCSQCHSGLQFTNYAFENNGLYESYANKDRGRERITLDPEDEGKFRVATLRNIEMTAPYMHDGSLPTLESVLGHYASHGSNHKVKNPLIDEIELNEQEQSDIIAFLKTLTDLDFLNNSNFNHPDVN